MNTRVLFQAKPLTTLASPVRSTRLQRKCACGGTPGPSGECETCRKKRLQRNPNNLRAEEQNGFGVPLIVHEVLRSPGQPLDAKTRAFFEPRLGHHFGHVRVHTDGKAAESARAVHALAYTIGREVVFGRGQYVPASGSARKLIAHELSHVVQQSDRAEMPEHVEFGSIDDSCEHQAVNVERGIENSLTDGNQPWRPTILSSRSGSASVGLLQRACLPAAQCAGPRSTLTQFVADTEKKPENVSKAKKRETACTKVPRDPACTSDGHGASATSLTAILKVNYPSRLGHITGLFVNKDLPSDWGAVTQDCSTFMPPLPGGKCTFVPDRLETEGKSYQTGAKTVGRQPRKDWLISTISALTHETEHARFDVSAPIPERTAASCKFSDHQSNLSEMAAQLSEMHVEYRAALARPSTADRYKRFHERFNDWVKGGGEDISGIVKDLRCKCECADVDHFITKTAESVSITQKWDSYERYMIHNELRDPKWKLNWPIAPASVDVADLPTKAAAPLKFE